MPTLTFQIASEIIHHRGVRVVSLVGEEELTRPFHYRVSLAFARDATIPEIDTKLLHAPIAVLFHQDGEEVRRVTGIVAEAEGRDAAIVAGDEPSGISLTIVPRLWLLTEFRTTELFLEQSIPEILANRLESIGLQRDQDFTFSLRSSYGRREIVVQYEEDGLSFVHRLCEQYGITYHFEQRADREVVVFTDHSELFARFDSGQGRVMFFGSQGDELGVTRHARTLRRVPRQVVLRDYNYRSPQLGLSSTRATASEAKEGEVFIYGPHAKTPAEATHLATVRAEAVQAERLVMRGSCGKMQFRPGTTFIFEDADGHETDLMLTRVVHSARLAGNDSEPTYSNDYEAILRATPYRPPLRTPRPKIAGLVHGVVDGAVRGPYAEIDSDGRYRVQFRYDRSGRTDLTASHPVRRMETHGGPDTGMHFPLRPGTEVMIGFIEGDPDRPVIVGAAPNPLLQSPVTSRNHTENVLRSQARNELVMEDLEGRQRIRLATPHTNTVLQLGSLQEPEMGALIRTDASVTSVAGKSVTDAAPIRTSLAVQGTTLVSDNLVQLAGLTALGAVIGQGAHDHARLDRRSGDVLGAVSSLSAFPASSTPPTTTGGGATKTFSAFANNIAGHAQKESEAAVSRMTVRTRKLSAASGSRSGGQPPGSSEGPHAVLGSSSGSTVFAREQLLLFGERVAALSSDEVSRVVGGRQIEIHSPEEIEIAGRRVVRMTSANLVDVQGRQFYLRGGGTPEDAEVPPEDISVAILADRTLRLKSANGALVACAEKKLVLNSHSSSASLSAAGDVNITGSAIHESGGAVSIAASKHGVNVTAKEDIVLEATKNVRLVAVENVDLSSAIDIVLEAGGAITIRATQITLEGPTKIDGDLTVTGQLNSQ